MKIKNALISLGIIFTLSGTALASEMKLAIIDVDKVIQSSSELPAIQHALEQKFNGRHTKIMSLQKKIEADQEKFHKDLAIMSESEKKKMATEITKNAENLKQQQAEFEQDFMKERNEKLQALLGKVKKIVDGIAENEKYDMVLSRSSTPYARPKYDITDDVIEKLK